MAEGVDHTHGDTGVKPAQDLNFQDGDYPDPEEFDWFWSQVPSAINDHKSLLEAIDSDEDGIVDRANELAAAIVGNGLKGGDSDDIEVEPAEFTGDGVEDDGSDNIQIVDEYIEDLVAVLLSADDKLNWTYDDPNSDLKIATTALDQEEVEDVVGGMLSGGTGISVSYDDPGGTITITGHTRYTDQEAVDAVNGEATLSVDISGNADTLDGEHASAFADASHVHDASDLNGVSADSVSDAHHAKTQPSDIDSANWNDYEIQKNGVDGVGIINFKTQ